MDASMLWACAAMLFAVAAVWFAYAAAEKNSRDKTRDALRNIVVGLEWELAFIRLWAQSEESPAYLQSKTNLEYQDEERSWKDPSGLIHSLDHPAVKKLTRSPYSLGLRTITGDFSTLNHAVAKFYSVYDEYRRYVTTRPQLYNSVSAKSVLGTSGFTQEENQFLSKVFEYNYQLHVELMGGEDSPEDQRCLHNVFRQASASLQSFKESLEREPSTRRLFGVLHLVAAIFVAAAVVLMVQWARLRFGLAIPRLG